MKKIAVLLTCFNRKDKTLNCLKSLNKAIEALSFNVSLHIYLVDDGSTDGTSEAILSKFPEVNLILGSGNLFWAGGMRLAWETARKTEIDYFLLLNDDTLLHESSINSLLKASTDFFASTSKHAVFIGSTIDKETGKITYGGRKLYSKNKPNNFLVQSETKLIECDLGNANIMMVSKAVVQDIGILSELYTHGIADYDYTLRAGKHGWKIFVVPGILGYCTNDHGNNWKSDKNLQARIEYMRSPKGLAYDEYLRFIKIHFPLHFPAAFFKLWLKALFPIIWDRFKKVADS